MTLLKDSLQQYSLILGSKSPRREMLLRGLDINFRVEAFGSVNETIQESVDPILVPIILSKVKSHNFHRPLKERELLITADTLVICNGEILGKPADEREATLMLTKLSNNMHTVVTGVTLRTLYKERNFSASTKVFFNRLTPQEIEYYIKNYEPYDKAGSYGAQDWIGHIAISSIEGSYFNVIGLPVERLYQELIKFLRSNK